jgi:hypothetical protein
LLNFEAALKYRQQEFLQTIVIYSRPPNTEPRAVFGLYLMPGPTIWYPDRPKTGHLCPVTSIDRFIKKRVIYKIFFMPKRSRLEKKNVRSGFRMAKTRWLHSNIGLFGIQWPTVQYTSEYRTVRYSNGHFSDTFCVRLSNGPFSNGWDRTYLSVFQMVAAILFLPFEIRISNGPDLKWSILA